MIFYISNLYFKTSVGSLDFGSPDFTCKWCKAKLWIEERAIKSKPPTIDVEFSLCCQKGYVDLPYIEEPPKLLLSLLDGSEPRSKHYQANIRAYNSMFAFTSLGGKVFSKLNNGNGPPQFILSGQNCHRIGSLLPEPRSAPKFAQLYIYDTQNEIQNRTKVFEYVLCFLAINCLFLSLTVHCVILSYD